MTVHYAAQGFVFKKEDRGEADRIFSVFTKEFGRLEVSGRAIRKIDSKLRGGIELFTFCDIEFIQGKNKKTLTEAKAKERFLGILQDPHKFSIAQRICKLVDSCIHGQEKDEHILQLLLDVLSRVEASKPRQLMYYYFFWNFVSLLGYGPHLENMQIPAEVAKTLQMILKKDWNGLENAHLSPVAQTMFQKVSDDYVTHLPLHANFQT